VHPGRDEIARLAHAAFVEHDAALRRFEIQFERPRTHISCRLHISCSGIDRARSADRDEQIAFAQGRVNFVHPIGHLPEPDDVGTERGFLACRTRWSIGQRPTPRRAHVARHAPRVQMFPVHMDQPLRASPLMQVIHILRHDEQIAVPLRIEPCECLMRCIVFRFLDRLASHVIEAEHQIGIARKPFRCRNILDAVLLPQPAFVAKRADTALSADASTGQDHDIADVLHLAHEAHKTRKRQVMTGIGIVGSEGRMGRAIAAMADEAGIFIVGGIDQGGDPIALAKASDVLVDFSSPSGLVYSLGAAVAAGKPIVIGTTGLEDDHHRAIDDAARHVAVLQTGNTSLGVTLLARLVKEAAAKLGPDWDIEIIEMHHRHKIDAPSGTALLLGRAAAEGRAIPLDANSERGRDGITGARKVGAIGFASLRGGSVAGDHTVIVAAENERLEFTHRAENRTIFARGAIKAAQWLIGQPAGRYSMDQVLGM
jgi:4-hydroxy-tetrahydrodipicolinate reductase